MPHPGPRRPSRSERQALTVDVLITTRSAADLFFDVVIVGLLPWSVGRMLRARGARERALRERAERLDAERELRVRDGGTRGAHPDRP